MCPFPPSLPERLDCPYVIRDYFNELRIAELAEVGVIHMHIQRVSWTSPGYNQPAGTVTEVLRYFEGGRGMIAVATQFRQPSGVIGASGMPDPKALWYGDEVLVPSHADWEHCDRCAARRASAPAEGGAG